MTRQTTRAVGANVAHAGDFPVVGIGASAGGLEALTELLHHLPLDTGMAFVLVQHLAPTHESMLPAVLGRATQMRVSQVTDGVRVEPNQIYVIPPNTKMAIAHGVLSLLPRATAPGRSLPIDFFFRSLALDRKDAAIGIVLSGTASDATQGLKAIKAEGGITFAQDPTSAKYDGMPQSAIMAGAADFILAPAQIADELAALGHGLARLPIPSTAGSGEPPTRILQLLRNATGVDFTHYKQTTINRRIARRMALHKLESLADYLQYIERNPLELGLLYDDIFIHVTSFFRDPEVFTALKREAFPELLRDRAPNAPVRIWVPGCSTGEEVYSIAISFLEFLEHEQATFPIQVFGSDISDSALLKARSGTYSDDMVADVSAARLKKHFTKLAEGYRINKSIRDVCVFVKHDLTRDPPFSKLDALSCRNVLIYFDGLLQKRVLPVFHDALNQPGFLILGTTETVSGFGALFSLVDKTNKIYARKPGAACVRTFATGELGPRSTLNPNAPLDVARTKVDLRKDVNEVLLAKYAPASAVINDSLDIQEIRGKTNPYLGLQPGYANLNILKLVREGLLSNLRLAIKGAKEKNVPVRKEGAQVRYNARVRGVSVEVIPLGGSTPGTRNFLVLFEDAPVAVEAKEAPPQGGRGRTKKRSEDPEIVRLRRELVAAKEYLDSLVEEHANTGDELAASNEELLSSNEELQSTNEELVTAKEELQSTNEELTTVNDELNARNQDLNQLGNDLINLLAAVEIPIVIVDRARRIRRFTPKAGSMMNLLPRDVGRALSDFRPNIDVEDLDTWVTEAIETIQLKEKEVRDKEGHWHRMQIRPYKTTDHKIDGAVISVVDIDALKHSVEDARHARDYAASVVETTPVALLVLDGELRVRSANSSFLAAFHLLPAQIEKRSIYDLGSGQWKKPALMSLLKDLVATQTPFAKFEVEYELPLVGPRTMLLSGRAIPGDDGIAGLLIAIEDVTDRKVVEEERARLREEEKRRFLDEVSAVLLPESLDDSATLATLARAVVPKLADWCIIDLIAEDGSIQHASVAHSNPEQERHAAELQRRRPVKSASLETGAARVVALGRGEVFPEVENEQWLARTLGTDHPEFLRELGARSYMCVPLLGRRAAMGAITFVCGLPARRFRVEDLGWAEELGRRAGLAIENARHYREAREALAARDEFLSVAAHELRTPLTALKLQLQGLESILPKPREERITTKLDRAMRQTERFTQLVESLLDVSRLTAGHLELEREETDLTEVTLEVVERFRELAERAHSELALNAKAPVVGQWDRLRLDLIVTNLLTNAIRYAPGKPIEIVVEGNATTATLTVRDHGPGIPADQQSRIFERFGRVAGLPPFGGLGLGLYIARQSVEAHGGIIRVSSQPGAGATFIVELPRQAALKSEAS